MEIGLKVIFVNVGDDQVRSLNIRNFNIPPPSLQGLPDTNCLCSLL